jgi:hypothetical protein
LDQVSIKPLSKKEVEKFVATGWPELAASIFFVAGPRLERSRRFRQRHMCNRAAGAVAAGLR